MNLLERVLTLLRANLNTVIEKSDDPERVLKQIQLDMRNQLVQVKTEVAKAIAEGHVLQKHMQTKKTEADQWLQKAEQAVQQANDEIARQALRHYNDVNTLIQRYQQQKHEQEQQLGTMRSALHRLEAKIIEVDTIFETLAAQKRNALIQQRVYNALHKTDAGNTERVNRVRNAITSAETHATASGTQYSANRPDAQNEKNAKQLSAEQNIEQQLQELKDGQPASTINFPINNVRQTQRPPQTGPLVNSHTTGIENNSAATKKRTRPTSRRTSTSDEPSTDRDLDLTYLNKLLETPQNQE